MIVPPILDYGEGSEPLGGPGPVVVVDSRTVIGAPRRASLSASAGPRGAVADAPVAMRLPSEAARFSMPASSRAEAAGSNWEAPPSEGAGAGMFVLAVVLPPVAVLLHTASPAFFVIAVLLTLMGYVPGLIFALWVLYRGCPEIVPRGPERHRQRGSRSPHATGRPRHARGAGTAEECKELGGGGPPGTSGAVAYVDADGIWRPVQAERRSLPRGVSVPRPTAAGGAHSAATVGNGHARHPSSSPATAAAVGTAGAVSAHTMASTAESAPATATSPALAQAAVSVPPAHGVS
jgi:uncharacterized membrane protein YqaE (UPF0057 family)